MKEIELAEPVVEWLQSQNWNIYQEVQFFSSGGIADICAERHGVLWIIETKTAMTIEVLLQASRWPVHYRSIGVPKAHWDNKRDYRVARYYYGVGVLEVSEGEIYEAVKPPLYLRNHGMAKRMLSKLTELHMMFARAGSQSGNHLTPYKMTMMDIKRELKLHPGRTISELFEALGKCHYASKSSFKGNVLKCLEDFEIDWCKVDKESKPFRLYLKEEQ